jgi:hypothetical protein
MKKFLLSLVALFCILPNINNVSAQDEGNFRFGFRTGYYFRTKAYGLGVYGSYGIFDWLNIEPGVNFIFKESSSVDIYCDFTVPLEITPHCYIYPIAGISIHDITSHSGTIDGWAGGLNLGLGSQYYINRRWSANAQIKWMGRLPQRHKSAVIFSLGIDYNF